MYVEQCGYYDNGRLYTWLPYKRNADSSSLIHEISGDKLLGDQVDKYYTYFYRGPQVINKIYKVEKNLLKTTGLFNGHSGLHT